LLEEEVEGNSRGGGGGAGGLQYFSNFAPTLGSQCNSREWRSCRNIAMVKTQYFQHIFSIGGGGGGGRRELLEVQVVGGAGGGSPTWRVRNL
jgi:hypothetical protein